MIIMPEQLLEQTQQQPAKMDNLMKSYIALQAADALMTPYAMGLGAKEMNPMMRPVAKSYLGLGLAKLALVSYQVKGLQELKQQQPLKYKVFMVGLNGLYGAALLSNAFQLSKALKHN